MNVQEFKAAFAVAKAEESMIDVDISVFWGFGLPDFKQVFVTLRQVAALIRWQCGTFAGDWDAQALQEIQHYGRTRFVILDGAEN